LVTMISKTAAIGTMRKSKSALALGTNVPTTSDTTSPQPSRSSTTLSGTVIDTIDERKTPLRGNLKRRRPRTDLSGGPRSNIVSQPIAVTTKREYRILRSQTLLLAGATTLGFLLFILFTLPIGALIGLGVMITSILSCILVTSSAAKTWYELQLDHPLGLLQHLPSTAREYLIEKSLTEVLCPALSSESLLSLRNSSSKRSLHSLGLSLSQHNSSFKGSLSSLPQAMVHTQQQLQERVKTDDGKPPQAILQHQQEDDSKKPPQASNLSRSNKLVNISCQ